MVQVRRFIGRTAREALAALKAELGHDAVVLSNRAVEGGVEIVALPSEQMQSLSASLSQSRQPQIAAVPEVAPPVARAAVPAPVSNAAQSAEDDFKVTLGDHIARLSREQPTGLTPRRRPETLFSAGIEARAAYEAEGTQAETPREVRAFNPPRVTRDGQPVPVARETPRAARMPAPMPERVEAPAPRRGVEVEDGQRDTQIAALEASNARMVDELASIKGLLERQLAGFAWSEVSRESPARAQLMGELLEAGFSARIARELCETLEGGQSLAEARTVVRNRLARRLKLMDSDADIIERGGVYALVGPTGVGKTTTAAKLAARCVVRHGADKLALITTDGYRIGAHEQLRIYGRILGVPVHVVRDAADLRQTLQDLRHKHMVIIDTIGMSQRDKMVVDQAAMLTAAGRVRRLLVLNATARGDTLDDVVRAYDGPDLAGCLLSKIDESASLAGAVDVALRHDLKVFYVANGQRVPEDLHLPNRAYLVHRAMRELKADSPYKLEQAEASMLMTEPLGRSGRN